MKLSGEAMMGDKNFGHDMNVIKCIAQDIKEVINLGVQVCIVVGGGNICRGSEVSMRHMERASADYMGMLGTVINGIALQSVMENFGIHTRVASAITMVNVCEPYIMRKARRHIEKGRVVIFVAGTGDPFFTTDTASVLRAVEMNCDILMKGTKVDGVFSKDPAKYQDAVKYEKVTYKEVIAKNLSVMDTSAIGLAKDNNLPIKVFSIKEKGNFARVLKGEGSYTKIVN